MNKRNLKKRSNLNKLYRFELSKAQFTKYFPPTTESYIIVLYSDRAVNWLKCLVPFHAM